LIRNGCLWIGKKGRDPISKRAEIAYQRPGYRNFVLGILTIVYVFNFIDRQVINILGQAIISDLNLSDGQFGALSGIAFAAIYSTMGIPIALWADVGVRRNIVAISLTVWSAMTALCGSAQGFWQLFMFRAGVGLGEAGASPSSHSMISDMFPANNYRFIHLAFMAVRSLDQLPEDTWHRCSAGALLLLWSGCPAFYSPLS